MACNSNRKRTRDCDRHKLSLLHKRPKKEPKVPSLLDISAKCAARLYPYQEIEESIGHIPGPVQTRVMFHSFPENEAAIALYSSNKLHINATDSHKQPFNIGMKLYETEAVTDVIQIGFHLSGVVHEKIGICNRQRTCVFQCSMTFDRKCITSTDCTCTNKSLLWCSHIVAVALYRIRNAKSVPVKPPISDSVLELSKTQIQKLLLTLVSKKRNEILPAVQQLLDEVRLPDSEISLLPGVPDPTAGGCSGEENLWHIDDDYIKKQVRSDLAEGTSGKNIISLLNKVREMLSVKDGNFVHLLIAITDTIMEISGEEDNVQSWTHTRKIYDELESLWSCVMASPHLTTSTKQKLKMNLNKYKKSPFCPLENGDDSSSGYLLQSLNTEHLQENIWTLGAKIDSLNLCGRVHESLENAQKLLAMLRDSCTSFDDMKLFNKSTEPIFITYNMFVAHGMDNDALELALISLSNSYSLPKGEYTQTRLSHRYEQLISQLDTLDYTKPALQNTLKKYSKQFQDFITQKLDNTDGHDILPNHCFVRFLFQHLFSLDKILACDLALQMLPLNLNKIAEEEEDNDSFPETLTYNNIYCHIKPHLEYQQGELAADLLKQCYTDSEYLKLTLTGILEEIKQPGQLLKLAKLCQRTVNTDSNSMNHDYQSAAFELGVRSIRLISDVADRKSCIRWLVSCAVDTGRAAVDFLIRNWTDLFTPKEISSDVAPMLTSQPVFFHLKATSSSKKEELLSAISNMVIEACIKDPVPCVLFALTLCEENYENFELVCQIITESSDRFNAAQLFSVARYLESKKHLSRAFKVGLRALKKLDIGAMECQHPAICDILWVSTLACTLGMDELTQIVPVIENCVHNPLVLTDIAQRCSSGRYTPNGQSFSCYKEPLNRLVASAQKLFIQDVELKLRNITRKNYTDFTEYLLKIKRAFLLAEDGKEQFQWLVDYIMTSQKGKKKLHQLISQTFLQLNDIC